MTKQTILIAYLLGPLSPLYTLAARGANVGYVATNCADIVVGTVASRNETATGVSFDIAVQRVLKGAVVPGTIHVSHAWTRGGVVIGPTTTITQAVEGIWCLKPGASADWDVHTLSGPDGWYMSLFWPAAATLPAVYQIQNAALPDTLLLELAAGVEAAGVNPETAIGAAQGAQSSSLQIIANRFVALPNLDFQMAGLAGLMPIQPSAISSVSGMWPSISASPRRFFLVFAIRDSFRDPAPTFIQQLVQLASLSPELREASIHAISSIHTQAPLPFLAALLTSADPSEQSRGVFGLSSFANVCPAESPANVASMAYLQCTNQGPYSTADTPANFASPGTPSSLVVSFWLNWWNQNQASLQ